MVQGSRLITERFVGSNPTCSICTQGDAVRCNWLISSDSLFDSEWVYWCIIFSGYRSSGFNSFILFRINTSTIGHSPSGKAQHFDCCTTLVRIQYAQLHLLNIRFSLPLKAKISHFAFRNVVQWQNNDLKRQF